MQLTYNWCVGSFSTSRVMNQIHVNDIKGGDGIQNFWDMDGRTGRGTDGQTDWRNVANIQLMEKNADG